MINESLKNISNERNRVFELYADIFTKVFSMKRDPGNQAAAIYNIINKNIGKEATILEVGCGAGILCNELSKYGFQVIGVDRSKQMIELANTRYKDNPNISWILGDFMTMSDCPRADVVLLLYSILQTFPNRSLQIKCLRKVLSRIKNNGLIFVECTNDPIVNELYPPGKQFISNTGDWRIKSWNNVQKDKTRILNFSLQLSDNKPVKNIEFTHKLRYCDKAVLKSLAIECEAKIIQWRQGLRFEKELSKSAPAILAILKKEI